MALSGCGGIPDPATPSEALIERDDNDVGKLNLFDQQLHERPAIILTRALATVREKIRR